METSIAEHIERRPDRCSGRPCIAGTRIRVQDIVCDHEIHGLTPEQIAREYPHLSLAQIHAALAYYFDHREEIREQLKADQDFASAVESPSPTAGQQPAKDADADKLSS